MRLSALGGVAVLATTAGACQVVQNARAGLEISDAAERLLAWEGVTVVATVDATPEQIHDYLVSTGAREPTDAQARLLADLELTVSLGRPADEVALNDLEAGDPLSGAMTVNFGGRDVAGVKQLEGTTYVRLGGEAVIEDVYGGGEAAVSAAERFERDAAGLPASLGTAALALQGEWVQVEPFEADAYADALSEHGGVPTGTADAAAGALTDAAELLDPETLWDAADRAEATLRSSASLRDAGEERGAELIDVRMPAGEAHQAVEPLLTLLNEQGARFGLPPLADEPADPGATVTSRLSIRNGVLANASVDLAQFSAEDAPALPLGLALTGGSALNLNPPETEGEPLTPDDLAVALMYLAEENEARTEDDSRADIPGPIQP
ncbi:hypothetical protein [Streptomyces sp. SBT349]|uniref:hypothetical protein n=1 Tax=Streptomyces sp. SBT349 TaxID=1580539 RepID=UPI00066BE86E|nr:hypothetical protein [Streptomyces sp. SBT349]